MPPSLRVFVVGSCVLLFACSSDPDALFLASGGAAGSVSGVAGASGKNDASGAGGTDAGKGGSPAGGAPDGLGGAPNGEAGHAGEGAGHGSGSGGTASGGAAGKSGAAGKAGAAGNGQGGGTAGSGAGPSCGDGVIAIGERCDGETTTVACSGFLDVLDATGVVACQGCTLDASSCASCGDGRINGTESDRDCGGPNACGRCELGRHCVIDGDCDATFGLGCYGGICNRVTVAFAVPQFGPLPPNIVLDRDGVATLGIAIHTALPLPASVVTTFETSPSVAVAPWKYAGDTSTPHYAASFAWGAATDESIVVHVGPDHGVALPVTTFHPSAPTTGLPVSLEVFAGPCDPSALGTKLPRVFGQTGPIDVPTDVSVCLVVGMPPGSSDTLVSVGSRNAAIGATQQIGKLTYVDAYFLAPLLAGVPATAPSDVQIVVAGAAGQNDLRLIPAPIRVTALTLSANGSGLGTPTSPALGTAARIAGLLSAFPGPLQLQGPFSFADYPNQIVVGADRGLEGYPGASINVGSGIGGTRVLLVDGGRLRNLAITSDGGNCVEVRASQTSPPSLLADADVSGCDVGVIAWGRALIAGSGCRLHGDRTGLRTEGKAMVAGCSVEDNEIAGLHAGSLGDARLVGTRFASNAVAIFGAGSARIYDAEITKNQLAVLAGPPSLASENTTLLGGTIAGGGKANARGISSPLGAAHPLRLLDVAMGALPGGGVEVLGSGKVELVGGTIVASGDETHAAVHGEDGATLLRAVRVTGSPGAGVRVSGGRTSLLGGTRIEGSAAGAIVVTAGALDVRATTILGGGGPLVSIAGNDRLTLTDVDVRSTDARASSAPLVRYDRAAPPPEPDQIEGLVLRAGEGAYLTKSCQKGTVADPQGGTYIVSSGLVPFCF